MLDGLDGRLLWRTGYSMIVELLLIIELLLLLLVIELLLLLLIIAALDDYVRLIYYRLASSVALWPHF